MAVNYKDFLSDWSKSPVTTSIKELKEDRQKVRDLNRITAIENAKKSAINEKGELDYGKLRQNLFEQGFGENAEELVQDIATKRAQASGTRNTQMMQDAEMYRMGLISPEEFNRRWYNTEKVVEKVEKDPFEESKQIFGDITPDYTQQNIPQNIPQTSKDVGEIVSGKIGEIVVKPEVSQKVSDTFSLPELKSTEKIIQKTPAQISPDFLTESGDISKSMYSRDSFGKVSSKNIQFKLPEDNVERNYVLNAAKNVLGTDFKGDVNSETLDAYINDKAENETPPVGFFNSYKTIQEYFAAEKDRPAKVAQKKAEIIEKIAAERNTRFSQDLAKRGDIRAELGEKRAEAGEARTKIDFDAIQREENERKPENNPKITRSLAKNKEVYEKILELEPSLSDYKRNVEALKSMPEGAPKLQKLVELAINNMKANKQEYREEGVAGYLLGAGYSPEISEKIAMEYNRTKDPVSAIKNSLAQLGWSALTKFNTPNSTVNMTYIDNEFKSAKEKWTNLGGNEEYLGIPLDKAIQMEQQKKKKTVADMFNDKAKQSKSDSKKPQDSRASTKGR